MNKNRKYTGKGLKFCLPTRYLFCGIAEQKLGGKKRRETDYQLR